ncbi:pilus assembly protein [Lachnospiraceae bacterium]|nr:pilus assembly protein [Lachnospiraceae bacterium]
MPHIIKKERKKLSLRQYYSKGKVMGKASPTEALFYTLLKGSFTIEAALTLPVFLFAAAMILSLFLIMQVQYTVENALDRAVADTALLGELSEKQVENLTKAAFYKELMKQNCQLSLVQGQIAGFSWKGTAVDSAYIDVLLTYRLKFPINCFGKRTMKVLKGRRMHRWSGEQRAGSGGDKEGWVFITPNQSVYHNSRTCSHLKLSIKTQKVSQWDNIKKLYGPCGHCTRGQKRGTVVYLTKEGGCYHYRIDCSGLKRTVYMIKKKEAGNKRPCSRCGGG